MKRQKKCQFFNLAEQLATQNDIVNNTMDSIIATAGEAPGADKRSDWEELKKTLEKLHELNGPQRPSQSTSNIPAPKSINKAIDSPRELTT